MVNQERELGERARQSESRTNTEKNINTNRDKYRYTYFISYLLLTIALSPAFFLYIPVSHVDL